MQDTLIQMFSFTTDWLPCVWDSRAILYPQHIWRISACSASLKKTTQEHGKRDHVSCTWFVLSELVAASVAETGNALNISAKFNCKNMFHYSQTQGFTTVKIQVLSLCICALSDLKVDFSCSVECETHLEKVESQSHTFALRSLLSCSHSKVGNLLPHKLFQG